MRGCTTLTEVTPSPAGDWIVYPSPRPTAGTLLLCLPPAGGGVSAFGGWAAAMPPSMELGIVRLPGRESRFGEPPFDRMGPLLDALAEAVVPHLDRPFALFGHSLGARVAFELTRRLRREGGPTPLRLYVSACAAPQLPRGEPIHDLSHDAFVAKLHELGGTPSAVLANPELLEIVLPIVRADLAVLETCGYEEDRPLDCPIHAFAGTADRVAPAEAVAAWQAQTAAAFSLEPVPGDHFFLQSHRDAVTASIAAGLESATRGAEPGPR